MNVCIFGAVALGPVIGGIQASAGGWRPLFWIVAVVGAGGAGAVAADLRGRSSGGPGGPARRPAIGLAAAGCVAAFYGASELTTHAFLGMKTLLPLLGGLALIVILVVYQYRTPRPLLTIRTMITSTIPVAGIVVALSAAAASVSATVLIAAELAPHYSPLHVGLLYLPELGGALLTAVALGAVLKRREMHYLPLAGMIFLAAGIAVFTLELPALRRDDPDRLGADRNRPRRSRRARPVRAPASRSPPPACSGCSRSSSCSARWPPS